MAFKDTSEQAAAKALDRHISLSANAGSGKTHVLIGRMMKILEDRAIRPDNIVAITFTELAAGQIREKLSKAITDRMDEIYAVKPLNVSLLTHWSRLREYIFSVRISTIHGFCANLLSMFPCEAHVPINYKIITGADQDIMHAEIVSHIVDLASEGELPDISPETLRKLYLAFSDSVKPESFILSWLQNRLNYSNYRKLYDSPDTSALDSARDEYLCVIFSNALGDLFNILNHLSAEDAHPKVKNFIDTVKRLNSTPPTPETLASDLAEFKAASAEVFTQSGMPKSQVCKFKELFENNEDAILKVAESYKSINDLYKAIENTANDSQAFEYAKIIYKLGGYCIREYRERLRKIRTLDYDDLLTEANKLLENTQVRRTLQHNFKYVMVDEFQDTDNLQYEIISKIITALDPTASGSSNNLFIVGDPKQSIYRFRNADVKIFNKIRDDIDAANGSTAGKLSLTATFRLKPELTAFVNKICTPFFENDRQFSKFNTKIEYEPLVYAKPLEHAADIGNAPRSDAAIKFLVAYNPNRKIDKETVVLPEGTPTDESALICNYIQDLVNKGEANYSDFGILATANKPLKELAGKLTENGIPFVNTSGGNYFSMPEICVLTAFLKFLLDPADNFSLATLLRSGIFNFSNRDLSLILCDIPGVRAYLDRLKISADNPALQGDLRQRAATAHELLSRLRSKRDDLPITTLIGVLISETAWFSHLQSPEMELQIRANVDKFIELTQAYLNRHFKSLTDYCAYIDFITAHKDAESQAVPEDVGNAVTLSTVHKSKGLEYKHVILFNISTVGNKTPGEYRNPLFGQVFKFLPGRTPDGAPQSLEEISSSYFKTSSILEAELAGSERNRNIYVALTRAINSLAIVCSPQASGFKNSIAGKILDTLDLDKDSLGDGLSSIENETHTIATLDTMFLPSDSDEVRKVFGAYRLNISIINKLKEITSQTVSDVKPKSEYAQFNDELYSGIYGDYVSASRIVKYIQDKEDHDMYVGEHILGIGNSPDEKPKVVSSPRPKSFENNGVSGTQFGTIIHYVFEKIQSWITGEKIETASLENVVDKALRMLGDKKTNTPETRNRLIDMALATANSDFVRRNMQYIPLAKTEVELYYTLDRDYLSAILDFVVPNSAGEWEIWDWKSNRVFNDLESLQRHYYPQMKFYAFMLFKRFPEQENYATRLIFLRQFRPDKTEADQVLSNTWSNAEMHRYAVELRQIIEESKNYPFFHNLNEPDPRMRLAESEDESGKEKYESAD